MWKVSNTVVFDINNSRAYNWLNGEYIEFTDNDHPFLKTLVDGSQYCGRFKYWDSHEDFDWLVEKYFLIKSHEDIQHFITNEKKNMECQKKLHMILAPAGNSCNFRCVYCYENHNESHWMAKRELDILSLFIKKQDIEHLHIEFFGGEPLLNIEFILEFLKKINDLTESLGVHFTSSMTTNAFLLNIKLFQSLYELGVKRYQITVDGFRDDHNTLRPLCSGEGTYDKITSNLRDFSDLNSKKYPFEIAIRVNFNNETASERKMIDIIDNFKKMFGNDERFSFLFRPIGDYAGANGLSLTDRKILCSSDKIGLQYDFEEKALSKGLKIADYYMYVGAGSAVCYAGKNNSIFVDNNLIVKKCTVALDDPNNNVGYITDDGELKKNRNWGKWTSNSLFSEAKCTDCFFISQCQSNNCRLKNIKNNSIICPVAIIDNKHSITKNLVAYIVNSNGDQKC